MAGTVETSSKTSSEVVHYPGEYDFTIHPCGAVVVESDNIPKNIDYTFSTILNRLYVKRRSVCPFGVYTSGTPPVNSLLKIEVYSKDNIPVRRCQAHTEVTEREDFVSPLHYMRCENPHAIYHCCEETGALSIFLPYIKPEFEETVIDNVENMRFLCSSKSCIKKELFIKFSLCNSDKVLGHHVFGLHVCSTPGRDRLNHEEQKVKKKRMRKMPTGSDYTRRPETVSSQQKFDVSVKGRHRCDLLLLVNRGLELVDAIPFDVQEKYLQEYYSRQAPNSTRPSTGSSLTGSSITGSSADVPSTSSDTRFTLKRFLVRS